MKRINNFIIPAAALAISLLSGGCSKDFLNLNPQSTLNVNNFFLDSAQVVQSVNGAYAELSTLGLSSYWIFGEMRSDNTSFQFNTSNRGNISKEDVDEFSTLSTNGYISDFWGNSYTGIARCNDVLGHIGEVSMSDSLKNRSIGEVEFLRAFHYFNLVRQFGAVPLRLESATSVATSHSKGRASVDEVYGQITSDLKDAISKLPTQYITANTGRVSQGAAHALLAKVYLTRKDWDNAISELRVVQTLGYSLLPNYKDIFDPTKKNGAESIFEIQYLGSNASLYSNFMYQFAPYDSKNYVTGDAGTNLASTSGWNTPTQDMIAAYEAGDLRKDVSLATSYKAGAVTVNQAYVKKYNHSFVAAGRTNDNVIVLRYADVLLMLAEALNEKSYVADGEAFGLLNQVRQRAGLPAKTSGNVVDSLKLPDQAAFRDAIFKERKVELAFENHRWYDLLRTGQAVAIMNAHGLRVIAANIPNMPTTAYQVTENKLLLPIPQNDVINDGLDQNPQ
ncbi:RagB/SusD family nutrient uptake outer membrane protein [Flavitalea sp. BT771]|uniref:RagB/SusD family nutrient uptake outer membrane protein n=1 Tax=Flavitalea sp. BT771 TaxID=3063329 RepID=UPI0026E275B1|nr:RagB/SusD family nutrient uptake outer membrane protein [Flavitalea sp. BT771]MDO6434909.1 RagB/SusD family nutrient uptake outer membrane protein [Flavitalea sp. BT771]MDV6223809.1 RagB/SusD family nutrient uptake outer membrane protein [Flavitalea sp. BT771]